MLAEPALSTYTMSPFTSTLIGESPPDPTVSVNSIVVPLTWNTDTSSLPAFTTSNHEPSSLSLTAPWDPRPPPEPSPPVA